MVEMLNCNETAAYLRSHGVKISNEALCAGLEQGVFSFGCAFRANGKNRVIMVFKPLLDRWIEERSTKEE